MALVPPLVARFEHAGAWRAEDPPVCPYPWDCCSTLQLWEATGRTHTFTSHSGSPGRHTNGHCEARFLLAAAVAFDPAAYPFFLDTSPSVSLVLYHFGSLPSLPETTSSSFSFHFFLYGLIYCHCSKCTKKKKKLENNSPTQFPAPQHSPPTQTTNIN